MDLFYRVKDWNCHIFGRDFKGMVYWHNADRIPGSELPELRHATMLEF